MAYLIDDKAIFHFLVPFAPVIPSTQPEKFPWSNFFPVMERDPTLRTENERGQKIIKNQLRP